MEFYLPLKLLYLFLFLSTALSASTMDDRGTYIIHMDKSAMPTPFSDHENWYMSMLSSMSSSDHGVPPTHLYTYNHVLNGFSAVLSGSHLDQLEKLPGHIATYPETFGKLHTTHSPEFLGLKKSVGVWPQSNFGDDMIIGIIDTGIWPESESFKDDGMPPVPERWRGACESGTEFNSSFCNKKLIGARSFSKGLKQQGLNVSTIDDYDSPRDFFGHGTHTSSTAAGSPVHGANYFGYAKGTAIGVAPKAWLAMYKVLFSNDNYEAAATDTLAGIDQAIADGVDLISLSLGFTEESLDGNPITVGTFAAMEKGVFVSCSAGNSGPHGPTIFNGSPWITTIGAGTIDRDYVADVILGEEAVTVRGKSVYPLDLLVSRAPIYFGQGNRSKELCEYDALNPKDVVDKFVFCDFIGEDARVNTSEIERAGAAGAIFSTDSQNLLRPFDFNFPFVAVTPKDGDLIKEYLIKTGENATINIKFQITLLGTKPAPMVAKFSSRGPYIRSPYILKPDVLAPGVDILAAWATNSGVAPIGDDYLLSDFAIISGTSMSSPHVVGVAALVKAFHKDWSPAAIRSALMTTAYVMDNTNGPIIDMNTTVAGTPLDFGAGHVNPEKALDPGLVYDIEVQDYINYLCAMNLTSKQIMTITGRSSFSCDQASLDLNYPSFMVLLDNSTNTMSYTFNRVLTNVVDGPSVYRAMVKAPLGMKVVVQPQVLSFAGKYSKAGFKMTVDVTLGDADSRRGFLVNYGYLSWNDVNGSSMVTSPIVAAYAP